MRLLLIGLLAVALAGCGSSSSPPPPIPPPLPPSPSPSASPWSITQGSAPQRLKFNGTSSYFDFPVCASASACWVSYFEELYGPVAGKAAATLQYTVTGNAPVFNNLSPGNNCGGPATISLLLHQAGDNMSGQGAYAFFRWFSKPTQVLELGEHTLTVPLTFDQWTPVYPNQSGAEQGFATALANIGSIGAVLGGGCFSGHGASVTSGSARLTIQAYGVQ